jgi:hypothetical protein
MANNGKVRIKIPCGQIKLDAQMKGQINITRTAVKK